MPHATPPSALAPCMLCGGAKMPALPLQPAAWHSPRRSMKKSFGDLPPCGVRAHPAKDAQIPAVSPVPETATWDPEGLLSRTPAAGGHFARRERKQGG